MFTRRPELGLITRTLAGAALAPHILGCMNDDGFSTAATSHPNDPAAQMGDWDDPTLGDVLASRSGTPSPVGSAADGPLLPAPADPAGVPPASGCWGLPSVDRARLLPAPARAHALVGGRITGSSASATNDAVELGGIGVAPAEGDWVELPLAAGAYRYVTYYGPPGSYGAIAELELYSGEARLDGVGFGTAGSPDDAGRGYRNALDGDTDTWFEGPLPSDVYVGLDLGESHELSPPTFSPDPAAARAGDEVTLAAEPGASILYSVDGADPRSAGLAYTEPIAMPDAATLIKAVASGPCALTSPVAQARYGREASSAVQASMHIGNSLTDTIVDRLQTVAARGGIALELERYTLPGAGTWLYAESPSGGVGVPNVQQALRSRPFDHLSMQPFPNMPCQAAPSGDGADSDSGYMAMAWADAMTQNPDVQLWVYQQWPAPTELENCITGGGWTRGGWTPPVPRTWEDAVANELAYQELVRQSLAARFPDALPPYIVPGGLALVALEHAIERGEIPGMADFFGAIFRARGADIHLTPAGAYFITLVFYGCMFQRSPEGLANDSGGAVSDEQAAAFQTVAWRALESYPLSGIAR